jgi:hypothetical protein
MKGDGRFDVESISIRDKKLNSLLSSSGKRRKLVSGAELCSGVGFNIGSVRVEGPRLGG